MLKAFSAALLALLIATTLAACSGGGDDDPTATAAASGDTPTETSEATVTTAASEPTVTTAAASPTATTSATDSVDATVTSAPTGSPETGSFTDEEAALLDLLLAATELPGEWNQLSVEAPELSDSPGFCDTPRFPRAVERIAEVEVEYQSADGARLVLQNITQFPEDVAVAALAYVRETATCSEWTDATGTVFEISPADAPALGDESHAIHVAFQVADAGRLEGDITFVRIGGYVTIVTTLELGGYDAAFSSDVAEGAARKIEALTGTGNNVTDEESTLIAGLLTLDDLDDDWDQTQPAHRSDPASWTGLCDAELFPDAGEATARVAAEFYEGFEADSATLMQLLISYPTGIAEAAFDYEQEAASCDSFSSGDTDVTLEPDSAFPALGDESFAIRFTFDNADEEVGGYWIIIRVADTLTTLIYTVPNDLDDDDAIAIAEAAASRMSSIVR